MSDSELVKIQTQEIQVQSQSPVMQLAGQLAEGKITPEQMEKMLDVQFKWEANEARKEYHVAMAAFKENPPKILKDKNVKYTNQKNQTTSYNHARLGNVTSIISSALSKQGLTASWPQEQTDKGIKVSCKITHVMGHSEETSLVAAPDSSGGKNPIQAIGSTVSYLQRYTILAITGLATDDMDDDGNGGPDKVEEFQEPVGHKKQAVDKAFDALLDSVPDSKTLNYDKLCKFLVKRWGDYPTNIEEGKNAALTIVAENLINLVCEDKK